MSNKYLRGSLKILLLLVILYFFLFSINLLSHAFKLFGKDFAHDLLTTTADPFLALFLGILATSLIQSSSTTTSIVVGLVAANTISIAAAIPMIMGANIGTTVTNTLVSFGHATRRAEFRRALSAAIVHDIFNFSAVIVLFPLELKFHLIEKTATRLEAGFEGIGGLELFNPIKFIINPAIELIDWLFGGMAIAPVVMVIIALLILFLSLSQIVRVSRSMVIGKIELFMDRYLFRNGFTSFLLGIVFTSIVQSSSVTTSLIVPLAGAGILTLAQIYPYTLGANIGTTVTALLASLATKDPSAVIVAFSHLIFNIYGIAIFYPLKIYPITLATKIGDFGGKSKRNVFLVITCFIALYTIPILIFAFN